MTALLLGCNLAHVSYSSTACCVPGLGVTEASHNITAQPELQLLMLSGIFCIKLRVSWIATACLSSVLDNPQ